MTREKQRKEKRWDNTGGQSARETEVEAVRTERDKQTHTCTSASNSSASISKTGFREIANDKTDLIENAGYQAGSDREWHTQQARTQHKEHWSEWIEGEIDITGLAKQREKKEAAETHISQLDRKPMGRAGFGSLSRWCQEKIRTERWWEERKALQMRSRSEVLACKGEQIHHEFQSSNNFPVCRPCQTENWMTKEVQIRKQRREATRDEKILRCSFLQVVPLAGDDGNQNGDGGCVRNSGSEAATNEQYVMNQEQDITVRPSHCARYQSGSRR